MTLGRYSAERKRLELLPEEALYMFERGAIELWSEREEGGEVVRVAMTVQQAWAALIGHDELTVERFQVSWYSRGSTTATDGGCDRSTRTSNDWGILSFERDHATHSRKQLPRPSSSPAVPSYNSSASRSPPSVTTFSSSPVRCGLFSWREHQLVSSWR